MLTNFSMTGTFTVLFFFLLTGLCVSDDNGNIPHIVRSMDDQISIHLPDKMASTLKAFDPDFSVREMSDYPTWWTDIYEFNQFYAPFAIVGDFNGDYRLDVILDGDSSTNNKTIALLSDETRIEILVLRDKRIPVLLEVDLKEGRKTPYFPERSDQRSDLGIVFYKETTGNFDSQTKEILRLINDGFTVLCFR